MNMKYTVTVAGNTYEVEIENLNARPIVARVDGETFEVTPENDTHARGGDNPRLKTATVTNSASSTSGSKLNRPARTGKSCLRRCRVTSQRYYVKPGEEVETGQVLSGDRSDENEEQHSQHTRRESGDGAGQRRADGDAQTGAGGV